MFPITLPHELSILIFQYIENDYKTLYSCILVSKQYHVINIPKLWKNPFYSKDSAEIIINCLLVEDKDFLMDNQIKLKDFELLKRLPLYNYSTFTTELDLSTSINQLQSFIEDNRDNCILKIFVERTICFILDHSCSITKFGTNVTYNQLVICHRRFNSCFQNLSELECDLHLDCKLLDELTNICKNIKTIKANNFYFYSHNNNNVICDNLTRCIMTQKKIECLAIDSYENIFLTDNFKKAILKHSQSITDFSGNGLINVDNVIVPTLKNLKRIKVQKYSSNDCNINYLRNITLPLIETVYISLYCQPFLLDLLEFIKINGANLKILEVDGYSQLDNRSIDQFLKSIGECCKNLERLSIIYNDDIHLQLVYLFNNCVKLKSITFNPIDCFGTKIDVGNVKNALNQTLSKDLNGMNFGLTIIADGDLLLVSLIRNMTYDTLEYYY